MQTSYKNQFTLHFLWRVLTYHGIMYTYKTKCYYTFSHIVLYMPKDLKLISSWKLIYMLTLKLAASIKVLCHKLFSHDVLSYYLSLKPFNQWMGFLLEISGKYMPIWFDKKGIVALKLENPMWNMKLIFLLLCKLNFAMNIFLAQNTQIDYSKKSFIGSNIIDVPEEYTNHTSLITCCIWSFFLWYPRPFYSCGIKEIDFWWAISLFRKINMCSIFLRSRFCST